MADLSAVANLQQSLCSESTSLPARFRALFSLKHLARESTSDHVSAAAVDAIAAAFTTPSVLVKHELAYCLGQSARPSARPHLQRVLQDLEQDPVTRHEAAEALAALGDAESIEILRHFRDRDGEEVVVKETCEIAVCRIEWASSNGGMKEKLHKSNFASVDPAPCLPEPTPGLGDLEQMLLDSKLPLFQRYRAMFTLRDLASPPDRATAVDAVQALAKGFGDPSALFRHEIAYVFGQLSHPASIPALAATLENEDEVAMVRHEAAEALGSLGDEAGVEDILRAYLHDKDRIVRESVVVALDMAEYERGNEAEYATIPPVAPTYG